MDTSIQRYCAQAGVPMIVLMLVGFGVFAGVLPPPSPQTSPDALAQMFSEHRNAIRIGLLITSFGATLLAPFFAVITTQLRRIDRESPLPYAQLALAALLVIEFILPLYFLLTDAYRPERAPQELQLFHDFAWLAFVGLASTAVMQFILIGIAILRDHRADPIFPRWSGYFTLWASLLFAPGCLCVFFQTGPFSWRGLICWWIPLTTFGLWFVVFTWLLLKAISGQGVEPTVATTAAMDTEAVALGAQRQVDLLGAEVAALRAELTELRSTRPN